MIPASNNKVFTLGVEIVALSGRQRYVWCTIAVGRVWWRFRLRVEEMRSGAGLTTIDPVLVKRRGVWQTLPTPDGLHALCQALREVTGVPWSVTMLALAVLFYRQGIRAKRAMVRGEMLDLPPDDGDDTAPPAMPYT
jgi:hypothetical protein